MEKLKSNKNRNTKRYIAIALGILMIGIVYIFLALQINNWNKDRRQAKKEIRIIKDISEEVQYYKFLSGLGGERMNKVVSAAERLLNEIRDPGRQLTKEEIELDIHKLTWLWLSVTPTTVYDGISASGEFGVISSDLLRKKLTDLKANQEKLMQFEAIQVRYVDLQLRPFLNRHIDRTKIETFQKIDSLHTKYYSTPFTSSYDDLLSNREFANILVDLIFHTKRLFLPGNRMKKDLGQIESIIREEYPSITIKPYKPY